MTEFNPVDLKKLYVPPPASHKGMNGKLLIIGGSKLFHAASLWALEIASRIVDMVYYASVPENNKIVLEAKSTFKNGIVIPREEIENYIEEADCVLMGPGMVRREKSKIQNPNLQITAKAGSRKDGTNSKLKIQNIKQINEIEDEGLQTRALTEYLLKNYPCKRWVLDAGSLQEMETSWIPKNAILTPHVKEFEKLFNLKRGALLKLKGHPLCMAQQMAKRYNCTILLKGVEDVVCSPSECRIVAGGNSGMTKGGTGDVLAGLVAALYCKNDAFLAACSASFFNKKAADALFAKQGYYFNSSDLVAILPSVMKRFIFP